MITDTDIKKMKEVFTTKEDLEKIEKKIKALELKMSTNLQRSTDQLVDLITVGFSRTDKALERLEEHEDILNNHEHRLDKMEDKIFA